MKILHTSDWHLGAIDGEISLLADQKYFIDEICRIAAEETVDAVVIAGDIYDRSVASGEAIKLYDYAMTRLCVELGKKVIVVAGNHDSAERLATCRDLLKGSGLYITGYLEKDISKATFGDTEIYMLPWITEEKVKSILPEEKDRITSLEEAYAAVINRMVADFDKDKRHILVSHAFITNSETSTSDRNAVIGFATQIPSSLFDPFDYVALGHLHKPQDVTEKIRYSGTPMPYSFGKEEKQEKSVTIIDTADMSEKIVPLPLLHLRTTLEGTLDELLKPVFEEPVKNGYVHLNVTDQYVGLEALSELRKVYPNLLEVSGKTFEGNNASITLTTEDLKKFDENPTDVFKYFCNEEMGQEADSHLIELFTEAVKTVEEGTI